MLEGTGANTVFVWDTAIFGHFLQPFSHQSSSSGAEGKEYVHEQQHSMGRSVHDRTHKQFCISLR